MNRLEGSHRPGNFELSIEEAAEERVSILRERIIQQYDREISGLRVDAVRAETHARNAKWMAVASVVVTVAVIIIAIILL